MSTNGQYTEMVGTRITKAQKQYLDDNELNLRDIIDYHMDTHTNETKRLRNEEKQLIKTIKELEEQLTKAREDLKEVRVKLGEKPDENQITIEIITAKDRIINNCKIKNNGKVNTRILANYMDTREAKRILESVILECSVKDKDKFIEEVYNSLGL